MISLSPLALAWRGFARAVRRDEHGAVAIEFGLLALPFFAMIGAIMETAFYFMASQLLDSAVDHSVRLLRTGQAQTQAYTADTFRGTICDRLFDMFDCSADKLKIDVKTISSFSAADFSYPLQLSTDPDHVGELIWKSNFNNYLPGSGSQIVSVKVYYKWPTLLDFLGFNLSNAGAGYRLMASVRVFRNEPFGGSPSPVTSCS